MAAHLRLARVGWALGRAGLAKTAFTARYHLGVRHRGRYDLHGLIQYDLGTSPALYPAWPWAMHKNSAGTAMAFAAIVAYRGRLGGTGCRRGMRRALAAGRRHPDDPVAAGDSSASIVASSSWARRGAGRSGALTGAADHSGGLPDRDDGDRPDQLPEPAQLRLPAARLAARGVRVLEALADLRPRAALLVLQPDRPLSASAGRTRSRRLGGTARSARIRRDVDRHADRPLADRPSVRHARVAVPLSRSSRASSTCSGPRDRPPSPSSSPASASARWR